jgi:capsule polysaccharide export protein KpsE/RkpR
MSTYETLLVLINRLQGQLTPTMREYDTFKNMLEKGRATVTKLQAEMTAGCQELERELTALEPTLENAKLAGQVDQLMTRLKPTENTAAEVTPSA